MRIEKKICEKKVTLKKKVTFFFAKKTVDLLLNLEISCKILEDQIINNI
jgi:hypothetical protein